ncbi:MAG: sulfite oxidase-like oxidoreductase [Candidatus Tectimicrobiota bacterium]|nr:MAG: sulfite oxidase-like oxidoreductase [Candidatus Tectomicrobia bacterium]
MWRWLQRKIDATLALRQRLPPGQRLATTLPVLHVGPIPPFDPPRWRLRLFGLVAAEAQLTYGELTAGGRFPVVRVRADLHCVSAWSVLDNLWEGVRCADVLAALPLAPEARHVLVHSANGYSASLPLADLQRPEVLLAWRRNGADLPPAHGYPLRLVVPHLYGWKSVKWVCALEFLAHERPGYWEQRGYHPYGDPWREQRYA